MAKFEIGRQVVTRGVYDKGMEDPEFLKFVNASFVRFTSGDWGDLCDDDKALNEDALKDGDRLLVDIKNVIFNPPATIVFWADGTKTVVKAHGEEFDPEKGLAMAISKKALGTGYYPEIKKWTKGYEEKAEVIAKQSEKSSADIFDLVRQYARKWAGDE